MDVFANTDVARRDCSRDGGVIIFAGLMFVMDKRARTFVTAEERTTRLGVTTVHRMVILGPIRRVVATVLVNQIKREYKFIHKGFKILPALKMVDFEPLSVISSKYDTRVSEQESVFGFEFLDVRESQ